MSRRPIAVAPRAVGGPALLAAFLLFGWGLLPAQELVAPHLGAARELLVGRLVRDLPLHAPEAEALAVQAADPASRAEAAVLRLLLEDEGFRLASSGEGAPLRLVLQLERKSAEGLFHLVVSAPGATHPFRIACVSADAAWTDPSRGDHLVAVGPWSPSAGRARERAVAALHEELAARFGVAEAVLREALAEGPDRTREIVLERSGEGATLHRAWAGYPRRPEALDALRGATGRIEERIARGRLLKLVGVVSLAVFSWIAYLASDLKTRGYASGRLRLLFATLFVLGAVFLWRIPA